MKQGFDLRAAIFLCAVLWVGCFSGAEAVQGARANMILTPIIHTGDPAPDGIGVISALNFPALNNSGTLAFVAQLSGEGVTPYNDYAIYGGPLGGLHKYARAGDPVPGGGGVYQSLPADEAGPFRCVPRLGNDGAIAFLAAVDPTGTALYADRLGIFSNDQCLALQGMPLPDFPQRTFLLDVEKTNAPLINNSGKVAMGIDASTQVPGYYDTAVYAGAPGSLSPMAHRGDIPPAPPGFFDVTPFNYLGFGPPAINDAGQVAFTALVQGESVGPYDDGFRGALYRHDPGSQALIKLAAEGDTTPGGTVLGSPSDVKTAPALNAAGDVAFWAPVPAAGGEGIFLAGSGGLRQVALAGEPIPGGNTGYLKTMGQPSLNDRGQIAFIGKFSSCENCTDTLEGIWLSTPDGNWREVVRSGQATPEGSGTFKKIYASDYFSLSPHNPNLNQKGWLAFLAEVGDPEQHQIGAYLFDGNAIHKTIRSGDLLEGKTVAEVGFVTPTSPGVHALNDNGQLALKVIHDDGSAALILARPGKSRSLDYLLLLLSD